MAKTDRLHRLRPAGLDNTGNGYVKRARCWADGRGRAGVDRRCRRRPWFPSEHAAATGCDRDALDEPLNQLRLAALVRIATWVRGVGQGYVLTPTGQAAAARGVVPALDKPARPATTSTSEGPIDPNELARPLAAVSDYRPAPVLTIEAGPPLVVPILIAANLLWFAVGLVVALWDGLPVGPYLSGRNVELLHRLGGVRGWTCWRGSGGGWVVLVSSTPESGTC
jgi:hypothetical protein